MNDRQMIAIVVFSTVRRRFANASGASSTSKPVPLKTNISRSVLIPARQMSWPVPVFT